jgi:DNA-binding response OmpR family regulator
MAQKLLVIDDEPDIGEFVCAAAEALGWDCTATTSVSAFLNALESDTALILLDLMIPEMDGIELLRLLGKEHCEVGIVLMSGIGKRVMETADELAATLGLSIVGHRNSPAAFSIASDCAREHG